ncbi:ribosomal-processing cysteine protease Prp [Zongyangia hominis]|uniref:Ribosomal processing cysteine protease Prp n=1 Tax=Zongyangia hominis TaxID=2763677 RepID=A0A926ECI8_9FIRM|nr:ribosomal-processing cysteine protease Prp [Zongyangia hominis]MBC8569441.1 ribosomal-processing cysteine protease Prp [Zongyangia hominis]
MVKADFAEREGMLVAFDVSGHAGFAGAGEDIVCAGVSSTLQMTANGITEVLGLDATVTVEDNRIQLKLKAPEKRADDFLRAFLLQLTLLSEAYPHTIKINVSEV